MSFGIMEYIVILVIVIIIALFTVIPFFNPS